MVQKRESELEKTQITSLSAVDDPTHILAMCLNAEINHPNVGETGCDQNAKKPAWIRNMALVKTKSTGLLVGKEGFNR